MTTGVLGQFDYRYRDAPWILASVKRLACVRCGAQEALAQPTVEALDAAIGKFTERHLLCQEGGA